MTDREKHVASQAAHRVLLVGATGRVGRMVRKSWDMTHPQHLDVAYQTRREAKSGRDQVVWDPLAGHSALERWVAEQGIPDAMIVLAGAVPGAGNDLSANAQIADACLSAARKTGVSRVLVSSSSAVYGSWKQTPFCESDALRPVSEYGQSKIDMEEACKPYQKAGLEICCLRIGNVTGADALLLNAQRKELEIDQFASGGFPVRSYIGPQTLSASLESLVRAPDTLPLILNLAAPIPVSMNDLANAAGINWRAKPAPENALERVTLDCSLLSGIHPFTENDSDPFQQIEQWQSVRENNDTA